jgi:peroxiredoxin
MYPDERSLVKKMEGKPFILLGINSDPVETLKQTIEKEHMTWPSFSDGGTDGPISSKWNVHSWPTTYVLDSKHVIRFKDLRGDALDEAVEKLVKEAEDAKPEPGAAK